eukprot:gene9047-11082_t
MDSCIIKNECIDEMAEIMGVQDKVSDITERAMRGELDFNGALKSRLQYLKGMTMDQLDLVWKRIVLNDGAVSLIKTLKYFGFKIALISGGFTFFSQKIASSLGIDYTVSNTLEFSSNDNTLTGNVVGNIVDGHVKRKVVELLSTQNQLLPNETISMGDGSNDQYMIKYCNLGVAFHGKEILKKATPFQINFTSIATLCFYLPEFWQQFSQKQQPQQQDEQKQKQLQMIRNDLLNYDRLYNQKPVQEMTQNLQLIQNYQPLFNLIN